MNNPIMTIQEVAGVSRKLGLVTFDYADCCQSCGDTGRYTSGTHECVTCRLKARKTQYKRDLVNELIRDILRDV
jgi:DnaJ-class molecular chaperone